MSSTSSRNSPYPEEVAHSMGHGRCDYNIDELYNTFGVKCLSLDYPGCAATRRPWALLLNTFGVKCKQGNHSRSAPSLPLDLCTTTRISLLAGDARRLQPTQHYAVAA